MLSIEVKLGGHKLIKSFDEIFSKVKNQPMKKIAVVGAQDEPVLEAVKAARELGLAEAVLIGDKEEIIKIAATINMNTAEFDIIDIKDINKAASTAVELVAKGEAHMLMKGLIDTAAFLRAVLNKEKGLRTGKLMSHIAVFEISGYERLIFVTDAAFNMYPDLSAKVSIINNAVEAARAVGIETPKVAVVCAVEVVNADMAPTMDAAVLAKMCERGQIKSCIVDGPLALDNALSEEAARHKKINSVVAGKADILLMPNIDAGNVLYKSLTYTAPCKNGGILIGCAAPVILTSRADSFETKLNSIALAALSAEEA
jgi:phosphate butyryltransferase